MENFVLSPKEFLLLCAGLGVTEIYGIEDGYKDVNLSDISNEITKVQQSLEAKGYIESDFDGNSSVNPNLIDVVIDCATCSKIVALDYQLKSGEKANIVYYFAKSRIVKSEKIYGSYVLADANTSSVSDEIRKEIQLSTIEEPLKFNKVHIPQKELDKIKKMVVSDDKKTATMAMQKYFDSKVTDIIIRGFENKENFYSIVVVDFESDVDAMKNIMFINSDFANIKLQPTVIDLITEIEFEPIENDAIYQLIDESIKTVIFNQAEVGENNG